jgi:hypothetical protein
MKDGETRVVLRDGVRGIEAWSEAQQMWIPLLGRGR